MDPERAAGERMVTDVVQPEVVVISRGSVEPSNCREQNAETEGDGTNAGTLHGVIMTVAQPVSNFDSTAHCVLGQAKLRLRKRSPIGS
jgi:hypothetical protein